MIIVANKVDLAAKDRAVSKEEGQALATEFGASFLEVSAKQNLKVKEAFETLIRTIISKQPTAGSGQSSGGVFGGGVVDRFILFFLFHELPSVETNYTFYKFIIPRYGGASVYI